jgi:hypothetical protein
MGESMSADRVHESDGDLPLEADPWGRAPLSGVRVVEVAM